MLDPKKGTGPVDNKPVIARKQASWMLQKGVAMVISGFGKDDLLSCLGTNIYDEGPCEIDRHLFNVALRNRDEGKYGDITL